MYTGFLAATSNRIKWTWFGNLIDPSTQAAIDISGSTIKIGIRAAEQAHCNLTGSTTDGHITLTDPVNGQFKVSFTASEMRNLIAGEYEVGLTIVFASGDEDQILAASLPVVDGVIDP